VAALHPYTPGEQPRGAVVKLNTNENPHAPSPAVASALAALRPEDARKYPDPTCAALRAAIAGDLAVDPAQVIVTNGSDEALRLAFEAYADARDLAAWLWPTYSLYPVFAAKGAVRVAQLPFGGAVSQEDALATAPATARLLCVANPNPPLGRAVDVEAIRAAADRLPAALVISDEAYIAYGGESALRLVQEGVPNVLVTRSFSKSHALAGMRVGFAVGAREVIVALNAIRDSYNVSAANQAAALAAWRDKEWLADVVAKVQATRGQALEDLRARGFAVEPSDGNFLFARRADAAALHRQLRDQGIYVRWFDTDGLRDGLRITIGTTEQMAALMDALDEG
jgi:histidinol-phosphate aminotransferase